jgi:hypothetical protein
MIKLSTYRVENSVLCMLYKIFFDMWGMQILVQYLLAHISPFLVMR